MAGDWPRLVFACLWTEKEHKLAKKQKKRTRPISRHLDRASWFNEEFIICLSGIFFFSCGTQRVFPSGPAGYD